MDFWNTIEEIKEQYFMGIRSAVVEILEEDTRTERNVERKSLIFVNFDYEVLKIVTKKSVLLFLSVGKSKHCQQGAASDAHRLNAQHIYYVYTNCIFKLIILTVNSHTRKSLPALHTASPALRRVNLSQV